MIRPVSNIYRRNCDGHCVQTSCLASRPRTSRRRICLRVEMDLSLHAKSVTRRQTQTHGLPDVDRALLCTSIIGGSVDEALEAIAKGNSSGADVLELRLDFYRDFSSTDQLKALMNACDLPYIVTYRPSWEGCDLAMITVYPLCGNSQHYLIWVQHFPPRPVQHRHVPESPTNHASKCRGEYAGDEQSRLAVLKEAATLGAPAIDVEYAASESFNSMANVLPSTTTLIMSHHNFESTPSLEELQEQEQGMRRAGAHVAKLAVTAQDICDAKVVLDLLKARTGPLIALSMGERGVITRLLATKYGGYLTFASMAAGKESAPGQPSLESLQSLYRSSKQTPDSKVFGIIGKPVSHSRSPILHNTAMQSLGLNTVFVPLLVDDMDKFCAEFTDQDWHGFCVTIPHKEAACRLSTADDVAARIGAVNTLIRQEDGSFRGHNTDWEAAVSAVADALWAGREPTDPNLPLRGCTAVVLGTGGAARALAFGAATMGARVVVAGRRVQKAQELADAVLDACCFSGDAVGMSIEDVQAGSLQRMDIVMNTTPLGMVGEQEDKSPLPKDILEKYKPLAFDAVYTPMHTRLLKEAQDCGCKVVTGLEMFVGQAAKQFEFFTGEQPPVDLMRSTVIGSLSE